MSTYAEITDGIITNRVVCDDQSHADTMHWVGPIDSLNPEPQIGWTYDGTNWTPPPPSEDPTPS